jgi:acyl dehydratase
MSERKSGRGKKGRSVVARCVVFCIVAAIIGTLAIPGLAAEQTSGTVTVTVNAPELVKAGETFEASIDVDNITDFNAGQFDLSFDASVVNVTDVADGSLDGKTIPVKWEFMDKDTIRVILEIRGLTGVSGAGNLAKIRFGVIGNRGDRSVLDISEGVLVDTEAGEIIAEWIDDEAIVGPIPVKVGVNAPEMVKAGETFNASIDVDSITDFKGLLA